MPFCVSALAATALTAGWVSGGQDRVVAVFLLLLLLVRYAVQRHVRTRRSGAAPPSATGHIARLHHGPSRP